ncbi:9193_t:CDS:1, partial [Funneliformis mosseae]
GAVINQVTQESLFCVMIESSVKKKKEKGCVTLYDQIIGGFQKKLNSRRKDFLQQWRKRQSSIGLLKLESAKQDSEV